MRAVWLVLLCLGSSAFAEVPDPDPSRFTEEIEAFRRWDAKNAAPDDAYLFVGSSSIRFWSTAEAFPDHPVVNRGFGGSELSDVMHFYDVLIEPFTPVKIFLYAGDNDVERGKSAQQVFDDFRELADRIAADFPETELVFLSIKPSGARWDKWPVMQEANRMVAEYIKERPGLSYADVASPLLDQKGEPGDFFVEDELHLNDRGYEVWRDVLLPFLEAA